MRVQVKVLLIMEWRMILSLFLFILLALLGDVQKFFFFFFCVQNQIPAFLKSIIAEQIWRGTVIEERRLDFC